MPKHLTHRTKAGWKYQRAVPVDLQALVGLTAWTKYLGTKVTQHAAQQYARAADAEHDATITNLRKLSDDAKAAILEEGGYLNFKANTDVLDWAATGNEEQLSIEKSAPPTGSALRRIMKDRATKRFEREVADYKDTVTARRAVVSKTALSANAGLGSLLGYSGAQSVKGNARARLYLERFLEHLGSDRAPRDVIQADAVSWRNAMKAAGTTPVNIAQHLAKVSALFATAVSEGELEANPFAGVKAPANVKKISDRKRAFTATELTKFMNASKDAVQPFPLIAECLLFSGARSSEIAGLRVCDVRKEAGVLVFDINDEARPLKNEASVRLIPVASQISSRVLALTKGRDGDEPLFGGIPPQVAGPGHWVQGVASKILRTGKIATRMLNGEKVDDLRVSAHSLRHLFTQTCDRVGVTEDVAYAVLGHSKGKTVHARVYKDRPDVKVLKAGVEKVAKALAVILK